MPPQLLWRVQRKKNRKFHCTHGSSFCQWSYSVGYGPLKSMGLKVVMTYLGPIGYHKSHIFQWVCSNHDLVRIQLTASKYEACLKETLTHRENTSCVPQLRTASSCEYYHPSQGYLCLLQREIKLLFLQTKFE